MYFVTFLKTTLALLLTHNLKNILYLPLSSFEVGTLGTWVIDKLSLTVTGNTKNNFYINT